MKLKYDLKTKRKTIVFLRMRTQFENAGDALIVRELIRLCSSRSVLFVDRSVSPDYFTEMVMNNVSGDVRFLPRYCASQMMFLMMICSVLQGNKTLFFQLPGGLGGEISVVKYLSGSLRNIIFSMLKNIGVTFYQVGVSYGSVGPRHRKMLRHHVHNLAGHFVRDRISESHLKSIDVRVDGVLPDLAINMFSRELRLESDVGSDRNAVGFSFRSDRSKDNSSEFIKTVDAALVQERCTNIYFVAQVKRDLCFMEELALDVKSRFGLNVSVVDCSASLIRCEEVYKRCSAVYSNRLHVLLLSAYYGATPFAIVHPENDIKIIGVYKEVGWDNLLVSIGKEFFPSDVVVDRDKMSQVAMELTSFFERIL